MSDTWTTVRALSALAQAKGGVRVTKMRTEWHIAGDCERPYERDIYGPVEGRNVPPELANIKVAPGFRQALLAAYAPDALAAENRHALRLVIFTRCRKCERCKRARSALWAYRAKEEVRSASRTWFGTLTLAPAEHARAEYRVRNRYGSTAWENADDHQKFQFLVWAISPDITRWIKRVRKNSGARLRYLLVAERHKTGLPHFHLLLHEVNDTPVRYRVLKNWPLGYTNFRLVTEPKEATYVCKYLSKDAAARVRASLHYGRPKGNESESDPFLPKRTDLNVHNV